jgi:two-component system alkaline phosphatase synthesis response regulator PhoP
MSPRRTILLVEDDPDLVHFARLALRVGGYRTVTATDGDEAIRVARKANPDVVLLDLRLAQGDGWQVLVGLRSIPALRQVPVLVLTASAGEADRARADAAGAADYLVKPMSVRVLLAAVERALGKPGEPQQS